MIINDKLMYQAITKEISNRFKQYRIAYPMTQKELAEKSMVSLSTIKRFENNEEISLTKLVQLLMALDLINNLDMLIPDQSSRPSSYAADYKAKQRVRKKSEKEKTWKWGDEE